MNTGFAAGLELLTTGGGGRGRSAERGYRINIPYKTNNVTNVKSHHKVNLPNVPTIVMLQNVK